MQTDMKNVLFRARRGRLAAIVVAALLVSSGVAVTGHASDETNPAIVHRQAIYKLASGHMNAIKSILLLGFEAPADTVFHAQGIVDAFSHMGNSYPPGSDKGDTEAKPVIWTEMEKFKQLGQQSFTAATALVAASQTGDKAATLDAFKKLGATCKACHNDFRKD
jgi:cytochrome c556